MDILQRTALTEQTMLELHCLTVHVVTVKWQYLWNRNRNPSRHRNTVSKLMIPPAEKTVYLTPGTDIPSSPGQRAVRHVDRGREARTTTTG